MNITLGILDQNAGSRGDFLFSAGAAVGYTSKTQFEV
jgi:hypothetical protein